MPDPKARPGQLGQSFLFAVVGCARYLSRARSMPLIGSSGRFCRSGVAPSVLVAEPLVDGVDAGLKVCQPSRKIAWEGGNDRTVIFAIWSSLLM